MSYFITSFLFCFTLAGSSYPQADQAELPRYSYKVTGKVIFSTSQAVTGATVYVIPATRPINGRIPFTHADKNGRFSIEFKDVPDEYRVCAHQGETGGFLPLAATPEEAVKMRSKLTCSKPFLLPGEDAERGVKIRLR